MSFTKIKSKAGETVLEWADSGTKQSVLHALTSYEDPLPAFQEALQGFAPYVLDVCELPADYARDLKILGVSITAHDTLGRGVVVTALKKLGGAQSPLVLNTPHVTENGASEMSPYLPPYAIRLLDALELEADRYRRGERAQQDLFKKAS